MAFVWELTKETTDLPLGCLQGGSAPKGAPPEPSPACRLTSVSRDALSHPGVELRENLKSISHRCHLFEVAFVWELTKETINLPLGCLHGGQRLFSMHVMHPPLPRDSPPRLPAGADNNQNPRG